MFNCHVWLWDASCNLVPHVPRFFWFAQSRLTGFRDQHHGCTRRPLTEQHRNAPPSSAWRRETREQSVRWRMVDRKTYVLWLPWSSYMAEYGVWSSHNDNPSIMGVCIPLGKMTSNFWRAPCGQSTLTGCTLHWWRVQVSEVKMSNERRNDCKLIIHLHIAPCT